MCEFCTSHGDGKIWFKNAANYAGDLMADLKRRAYIRDFFTATIEEGVITLGRLELIHRKKKKLPTRLVRQLVDKARAEHFGQVVTMEDIRAIVARAATVVRIPCACRWAASRTENRCCYSVSYTPEAWYTDLDMAYFGKAPDMGLESLPPATAISQMEELDKEGAVHTIWTMHTPFIGAICNCRPVDCLGLRTLALEVETMFRGEQVARVDEEKCIGCGSCKEACHFRAISSRQTEEGYKAVISSEQCFGCGLCRNNCPQEALSMATRLFF